ncbi:ComF family protein [Lactobacillus kalixensis]|uniref:Competence protein n=1 Tax=Lactobacillus kalixensis DSM 16043 TaxID=1423763 RepID=A0A0R1UDR8_9LACO|nr:ComF family protein [Lactobacillus kalixensis]KRL91590.1 competence protein [Lactobacillus kalixensis DSM 16043]
MNECLLCGQVFIPRFSFVRTFSIEINDERLCLQCLKKFERLGKDRCPFCDKNMEKVEICSDCRFWQKIYGNNLMKNHSIYRYNRQFHDLMVSYKRYGDYCLHRVLEELSSEHLKNLNFDYYVPIPTSPDHQQKRQFDTITAIYEKIVPLSFFLKKREHTGAQGEKNKQERLATPQGFIVDANQLSEKDISETSILLLDDIYTNGRTLYHARDKLLEIFPNAKIESFAICR